MKNKRVCYVEISVENETKRLDGIAMKFNIVRKSSTIAAQARIEIANLAKDNVYQLTTFLSPYINKNIKRHIAVYAGYEETGVGQIYFGDVTKAVPTGMPDTWLEIEAKSNYYLNQTVVTHRSQNIKLKELSETISKEFEMPLIWESAREELGEKLVDAFNHVGSKIELLKKFNDLSEANMFIDNGTVKVTDRYIQRQKDEIKLISKETGMIGQPMPDEHGVSCRCLLDPTLFVGDWFKLESKKLPQLNGYYQIYELTFQGSSREAEFYCDIKGNNYRKS